MGTILSNLPVVSNGNILPSVFVAVDPTRNNAVIQASGTSMPVGISQVGTLQAPNLQQALFPGTTPTTQWAATQGYNLQIFTLGDVCGLTVGSAGVTSGDLLTNDINGAAVTVVKGSNVYYGAMALQTGTSGAVIDVLVMNGKA